MRVSYGPPAHKGVTTLMAVGATDIDESAAAHAVRVGGWLWLAAGGLGLLTKSRALRDWGFGGAVALFGVRLLTKGGTQVAVTQPAPVPPQPAAP